MKILISGGGIAGPCLAYWLEHHGFEVTIVEASPSPRTGGYVIDFWGAGFDVAERMDILPAVLDRGYRVGEVRRVDRDGKPVGRFDAGVFDTLTDGRFTSLPRSELAGVILESLGNRMEVVFGDSVSALHPEGNGVRVEFERGDARTFDLVIGADGLHSRVRELAFGPEEQFEKYLGIKVAAFAADGYRPRDELTYVMHNDIGRQVGRFAMRDDRTMILFVFADPSRDIPRDLARQKALLHKNFADSGWECDKILKVLEEAPDLYIDRVSQIRMDHWARDRVALVGDAAFCVSLLGGQGSALAMTAAYILAGELKRAGGDHAAGFARYEKRLRSFIQDKQGAAIRLSSFFAPRNRLQIAIGNQGMNLMRLPLMTRFVARGLVDRIELPAY